MIAKISDHGARHPVLSFIYGHILRKLHESKRIKSKISQIMADENQSVDAIDMSGISRVSG